VGICERFEENFILMAEALGWEVPFHENQKVSKRRSMVEPKLADLIREHNRLDDELYEFGKKLFEPKLRKKEDAVREGLTNLRAIPRPGISKVSCRSSMCAARFLLNKIVSAI